jgi:DNA-binding response OmpR family regulator
MTLRPIVIVDDDETIAQLLGFVFQHDGFQPVVLHDGRAAEAYVSTHDAAAAVVLDVMLPYRDGYAVAGAIRSDARWKDVPILMLTARSLDADVEQGSRIGVNEYLVKPFQPRVVLARVRSLLGAKT